MSAPDRDPASFNTTARPWLDDHARRWRAGDRVPVEAILDQFPHLRDRPSAVLELIGQEVTLRERVGEVPSPDDYAPRFPELADRVRSWFGRRAAATTGAPPAGGTATGPPGQPDAPPAHGPDVPGYEVLGLLGRGGMGVVYQARHLRLNRVVALKMVFDRGRDNPTDRLRFLAEAEATAALHHPNIVHLYEVGQHDGCPYFTLEYCPGGSLADVGPDQLTPREAADLVRQLARGVAYAHGKHIIHRDLTPGNVLRAADGTPKIADFGLAKRLGSAGGLTATAAVLGTPAYMSPEQAAGRGSEVGPAADVYGLGAILYKLLTGRPPFRGETALGVIREVTETAVVAPRRLRPDVPRDLQTVCLKCLEKDPLRRYLTADLLADDLDRFLGGRAVHARPVSPAERAWRWARRHPAAAGLLAACLVAVLALGAAATGWVYTGRLREAVDRAEDARRAEADARGRESRARYFHHIALADASWRDGNLRRVHELLDDCPPESRQWEWHYLKRLCHGDLMTLRDPDGDGILAVAVSPDGSRLATAGNDRTVRVRDAATGRELLRLGGVERGFTCVAFSPDGARLAGTSGDGTARVWDARTGDELFRLTPPGPPLFGAAFDPTGRRLATGGEDGAVRLWDAATGAPIPFPARHKDLVWAVAFSPDGARLASASSDQTVKVWDAATGALVHTLAGHTGMVRGVAFSPDGARLATAGADRKVRLWDAASGKPDLELTGHTSGVNWVAFRRDGARVASAGADGAVRVWDVRPGVGPAARPVRVFKGHVSAALGVAFGPDRARLYSASADRTVKAWDVEAAPEPVTLAGPAGPTRGVAVGPDGRVAAAADADGVVRVWDVAGRRVARALTGHRDAGGQPQPVSSVAFSPDGTRLASGGWDNAVRVWDLRTGGESRALTGFRKGVTCVAFHPAGERVAAGSGDGTVRAWDARTGEPLFAPVEYPSEVTSVAFSPDGRWLVAAVEHQPVRVLDPATGRELFVLEGSTGDVMTVAFSRDGKRLATGGWDQVVRVWDAVPGAPAVTLRGHAEGVLGVAFSPDGTRLVSAGADHLVKVWDVGEGQEVLSLAGHTNQVHGVAFSPDGHDVISAGGDGAVRVWSGRPLPAHNPPVRPKAPGE